MKNFKCYIKIVCVGEKLHLKKMKRKREDGKGGGIQSEDEMGESRENEGRGERIGKKI